MIDTWRQVAAILGGVVFMTPVLTLVGDLAGDSGGGPLVAGLASGVGLGLLRLAGLSSRQSHKG